MTTRPLPIVFALSAMLLSGCSVPSIAVGDADDIPPVVVERLQVAWSSLDPAAEPAIWISGDSFALLGGGGSNCFTYPEAGRAVDESTIEVSMAPSWDAETACTMDDRFLPYEISTPDGIDSDRPVALRVIDESASSDFRVVDYVIADR